MRKAIDNWFCRHRNPTSLVLHAVGIPACFIVAPVMAILGQWGWAATLFIGGYALQFIGHAIEGNQSGEELLFRRLFGRPSKLTDDEKNGGNT